MRSFIELGLGFAIFRHSAGEDDAIKQILKCATTPEYLKQLDVQAVVQMEDTRTRIHFHDNNWPRLIDELKIRFSMLDCFRKPRPIVGYAKDIVELENVAMYLEGHYYKDEETKEFIFYPKDGADLLYVYSMLSENTHKLARKRKEVVVMDFDYTRFAPTGLFEEIVTRSGVDYVLDEHPKHCRFLTIDNNDFERVTDLLQRYKVPYNFDSYGKNHEPAPGMQE